MAEATKTPTATATSHAATATKKRRVRASRSPEVLDQIYQIECNQYFMKIDYMERKMPELRKKVRDAQTPQQREKISRDVNKLTRMFLAAIS